MVGKGVLVCWMTSFCKWTIQVCPTQIYFQIYKRPEICSCPTHSTHFLSSKTKLRSRYTECSGQTVRLVLLPVSWMHRHLIIIGAHVLGSPNVHWIQQMLTLAWTAPVESQFAAAMQLSSSQPVSLAEPWVVWMFACAWGRRVMKTAYFFNLNRPNCFLETEFQDRTYLQKSSLFFPTDGSQFTNLWRIESERTHAEWASLGFVLVTTKCTDARLVHLLLSKFCLCTLQRQDPRPPLDLSFWSFLTFLHHGI